MEKKSSAGRWLGRVWQAGAGPLAMAAFLALANLAGAQSYTITPTWQAYNGTANLVNDNNNRGLAYNVISNQVYIAGRTSAAKAISVLDGASGTVIAADFPNITIVPYNIGVADDGVIYGVPLANGVSANNLNIYAWTNWNSLQRQGYAQTSGDATSLPLVQGSRVGDSFAIYGSGTSTLILLPVNKSTSSTTNFLVFSTIDGQTFTPTLLTVAGLPATFADSGPQHGVAFINSTNFLFRPGTGSATYLIGFPANFASLGGQVAVSTLSTNTSLPSGGSQVNLFSYSPAAKLLADYGSIYSSAASGGATAPLGVYDISSFPAANNLGSTTTAHTNANGNVTGGVALGGTGKTNALYALDSNNGVFAFSLTFIPAAVAPVISSAPAGNSVYTNYGPYTFSVTAAGTVPLTYFWQYNSASNQTTATTLLVTSNSFYTISNLTVAASGWYDVVVSNSAGVAISAPVQLAVNTPLVSAYVTNLWSLAADNSEPYLDTGYNTRGLAFDPSTMSVLVAEHSAAQIYALDAASGSLKFLITTPQTGLPSGSIFPLGQVGVADDGVVYCCNVSSYNPNSDTAVSGQSDFCVVRFDSVVNAVITNSDSSTSPNPANTFEFAFVGDPGASQPLNSGVSSGDRWGDSMSVRGGGTNTQILLGTYESLYSSGVLAFGTGTGTNVAILTTQDGVDFTATTITVTNAPDGFSYLGVAWGASNTFWTKSPGYDLRQVQYDLNSGYGWVIQDFSTTAGQGSLSAVCGIGLDITNNILAGVNTGDSPNDLELFQIPSLGFPPESYFQDFFPAYNPNLNGNAATTIKYPYIFSLDANNGIVALKYTIPLLPFSILSTTTGKQQVLTWQTIIGHTYQLQATNALPSAGNPPWPNVGPPVSVTASGTLSYTNSTAGTSSLFYRVVAH